MSKLAVTLSIFTLACGGTDSAQTSGAEAAPPISATGEAAPAPELPEPAAQRKSGPEVASCLKLIQQQRFQEALSACMAARDVDPDNPEVKAAVGQAQLEVAKLAAAESTESASREAAARLDEELKALPGQPGE